MLLLAQTGRLKLIHGPPIRVKVKIIRIKRDLLLNTNFNPKKHETKRRGPGGQWNISEVKFIYILKLPQFNYISLYYNIIINKKYANDNNNEIQLITIIIIVQLYNENRSRTRTGPPSLNYSENVLDNNLWSLIKTYSIICVILYCNQTPTHTHTQTQI